MSLVLAGAVAIGMGAVLLDLLNRGLGLNQASGALRAASIQASLQIVEQNPLLGIGWAIGDASDALAGLTSQSFSVYNVFLLFAVTGGLPALFFFANFIARELNMARVRADPSFDVLAAFVAQGLAEANFFPGSPVPLVLVLVLALAAQGGLTRNKRVIEIVRTTVAA